MALAIHGEASTVARQFSIRDLTTMRPQTAFDVLVKQLAKSHEYILRQDSGSLRRHFRAITV